jgi:putative flippase GtrA
MRPFYRILALVRHPPATTFKMMSFALVGLGNTIVDFGVFTFAYKALALPIIFANVIAWLVAVTGSYIVNTLTTFRAETGRVLRRKDYINFVASGVLGVIATTSALVILSWYVPVLVAKLVSIFVGFSVNFAMSNFVVFRAKVPNEPTS